jgi:hypothetical protein
MNPSNVANDNYGFQARGSNIVAPLGESPWSGQAMARLPLEMATPMAALQGEAERVDLQGKSPMPSSDELTDKKIELAEAHTDTKIGSLGAKIDVLAATIVVKIDSLSEKIDKSDQYNRDTRWWIISIFVVGIFSLAALIVALTSFADARFGLGMNVRDVVQTVVKEQQEIQKRDTTQPRH